MTRSARLAQAAAEFIDLELVPFTLPGSRLLLRRTDAGALSVACAEYEVSPDDALALASLLVRDGTGVELAVTSAQVDRIELGGGVATITFAGTRSLSIGADEPMCVEVSWPDGDVRHEAVDSGQAIVLSVDAARQVELSAGSGHREALAATSELWRTWFDRCPRVGDDLLPIAAHCWWVLGANIIELACAPGSRAVVPSKLGYVALWQWDAYFIAIGLRHGDLDLAIEQLELALGFAAENGQLPDVVHDGGLLASSDDLPAADLARLRELGSPAVAAGLTVPLTKPPLAALALARLVESGASAECVDRLLPIVQASQSWWLQTCLSDDDLPEYHHPYSSGLDDSPVFDADLPVATPDLAAYLELQDVLLAELLFSKGRTDEAARHRLRAGVGRERVLRLWQPDARRFAARGAHGPISAHTVLDLLPLLSGTLPPDVVTALLDDLDDPTRFAAPRPVPTVALDDPAFDPDRMWRGPVWLVTNWLLIEGLQRSGHAERAAVLARQTLAMVRDAAGAYEYFQPFSGARAGRAVSCFGWTAALTIDLAVRFGSLANS